MLSLAEWFSTQGSFAPFGENLAFIGDIFGCYSPGGVVATVTCIEARDATKHPSVHTIAALAARNYLAQIINSAEVENADLG